MIRTSFCRLLAQCNRKSRHIAVEMVNKCYKRTVTTASSLVKLSGFQRGIPAVDNVKQSTVLFYKYHHPAMNSTKRSMSSSKSYEEKEASTDQAAGQGNEKEESIPKSFEGKFTQFRDEDAVEIPDAEEEYQKQLIAAITDQDEDNDQQFSIYRRRKIDETLLMNLKRGVEGVFDIEELVDFLRVENVINICVIEIPPEKQYADYMVIGTTLSPRHCRAVAEYIKKLHKKKKNKKDKFLVVEGERNPSWQAMDMGNIVLHLFSEEAREFYDLETLWTVGEEFDDQYQKKDIYMSLMQQFSYLGNIIPLSEAKDQQPPPNSPKT